MHGKKIGIALLGLLVGLSGFGLAGASAVHTATPGCVTSKAPDVVPVRICYTLFQPANTSSTNQVPMIMHGHGWGGSRTKTIAPATDASSFVHWLDAGFGVLSFDQRSWGESTGQANTQDPELEGYDIETLIDFIATLDWVKLDVDGSNNPIPGDPVLGAIGGSYGGGFQTIGALSEIKHHGKTRFNALSPEITWWDLPESLAPQGVVRSVYVAGLYAAGATRLPLAAHEGIAYGTATGQFPDGTVPGVPNLKQIYRDHSPRGFAEDLGIKLDIPVLFRQGITDILFNLNQGWHNYMGMLTPAAQDKSFLIGYNGGHVLMREMAPLASQPTSDNCSGVGGFAALSRSFFKKAFPGGVGTTGFLPTRFALSANDGATCISTNSLDNYTPMPVLPLGTIATQTTAGPAINYELATGPLRVAGIPRLRGTVTSGVDGRAFFALAVGADPATAQVVQNNLLPYHSLLPAVQQPLSIELPGVAVDVPAGQHLYLTVTPFASQYGGHVSRTPGAVLIENAVVDVPTA